jgi:hypothetical protein
MKSGTSGSMPSFGGRAASAANGVSRMQTAPSQIFPIVSFTEVTPAARLDVAQASRGCVVLRYGKRTGEAKNAAFYGWSAIGGYGRWTGEAAACLPGFVEPDAEFLPGQRCCPALQTATGRGSASFESNGATLRAQSLGWIDAVGTPEQLRKPARRAEAVARGNPGNRLGGAGAQHLRPGLL